MILDVPVFWAVDQNFLWAAAAASLAAFAAHSLFTRRSIFAMMLYLDGFGAALFATQAVEKVWHLEFGRPLAPIILGVVTAIGGGLIRDVLAGRPTLLMSRELYAVPVLLGCTLFTVVLAYAPDHQVGASVVTVALIFTIRAAAIHWDLKVPDLFITKPKADG